MKRRTLLLGTVALLAVPERDAADGVATAIASGDPGTLARVQTSHRTDRAVGRLLTRDHGALNRLRGWASGGGTDVLRVNATGILAKTGAADADVLVARTLQWDDEVRDRYLAAVVHRTLGLPWDEAGTFDAAAATPVQRAVLRRELRNPYDAGARWCADVLLGRPVAGSLRQPGCGWTTGHREGV